MNHMFQHVVVLCLLIATIQASTPVPQSGGVDLSQVDRGVVRCFIGKKTDFHEVRQIRLMISHNERVMSNIYSFVR